jgi:hypothetical protein
MVQGTAFHFWEALCLLLPALQKGVWNDAPQGLLYGVKVLTN